MYNYNKECGDCQNCWMRKIPTDMKIREDVPVEFIYDIYCNVDDTSLGSLHNPRAQQCKDFILR